MIAEATETPTYRIRDWSKHFENSRTRDMKNMLWVPIPTKHDGDGYAELLDHPNGAAHYAVWVACVATAAKSHPRGTLVRDGCRPHSAESLSRKTKIPAQFFREAMPRLVEIGWLEIVDQKQPKNKAKTDRLRQDCGETVADVRQDCGETVATRKGREEKDNKDPPHRAGEEVEPEIPEDASPYVDWIAAERDFLQLWNDSPRTCHVSSIVEKYIGQFRARWLDDEWRGMAPRAIPKLSVGFWADKKLSISQFLDPIFVSDLMQGKYDVHESKPSAPRKPSRPPIGSHDIQPPAGSDW